MEQLYQPDIITLATGDKELGFEYNKEIFERAAEWIHECGGFTPAMLKEQPAMDVLNETFRVIGAAVSSSITEEVPSELIGALENNAFIFSGFKTYHSLNEVGISLVDDKGALKPFETVRKDVEKINAKYNTNYLYAEYNHAVSSSQMAVKWHDFEQDGDRYNLQYRTAGDERVRAQHQSLHEITLPLSDPFWSQFLPPNGWNCRCTVVQVRKSSYPTSDSAKAIEIGESITAEPKAQIFRFNPGKELKLFPDKHPYNKAPKEVQKVVAEITDDHEQLKQRIANMIVEMPNNLTSEAKIAIAKNNIEIEKALNITKGKPMTVEDADKQNANPNYGKDTAYGINCQTCAPAYALRSKGFGITAKPCKSGSKLEYLSRGRAFEVWQNIDGTQAKHKSINSWLSDKGYVQMTEKRYREFFNENCKEEGIYELSIGWRSGGGHATILQRFSDGELRYIEPQQDNSPGSGKEMYNTDFLCKSGATKRIHECRGIMRIDNKLFNLDFVEIFDK